MTRSFLLVLLASTAVACGPESHATTDRAAMPAGDITVRAESVSAFVTVEGSVEARRTAEISTRLMARISAIAVDIGSHVRAGQPVIRLGTDDVAAHRIKADAQLAAAEAAHDEAARHAARMDTLYGQDAVARVQRDQARLALTQAESHAALARAGVAEVAATEAYATVRAPFAGTIVRRHVDEGDLAAPGMPLLRLEATGPRDAVLSVPADLVSFIAVGSPLEIAAAHGASARATVRAIAAGADSRTRTVEVRAILPTDWVTGTGVSARVPAGVRETILIPERAIVRRGQLTGVRVATPEGVLIRWVRLGRRIVPAGGEADPQVEVLSGLVSGERIAL